MRVRMDSKYYGVVDLVREMKLKVRVIRPRQLETRMPKTESNVTW
jgi:hypothetical protein